MTNSPEYEPNIRQAVVFVIVKKGEVLVESRQDTNTPVFPGGKIKPGESPLAAVVREMEEEIGIVPVSTIRLKSFTSAAIDGHQTTMHPFLILSFAGSLQNKEKRSQFFWVDIEKAATLLIRDSSQAILSQTQLFLSQITV